MGSFSSRRPVYRVDCSGLRSVLTLRAWICRTMWFATVRCGFLGVFSTVGGQEFDRGAQVIARTDRGLEAGDVLCPATPEAIGYMKGPGGGQILRPMTNEDRNEQARMQQQGRHEAEVCQEYIQRLGLKMQLVDVERIFGGERIVVYYLAESRVTFASWSGFWPASSKRGSRCGRSACADEAKLLADFGDCGCAVCCNTHLVQMPPVSMRMAKLQKATLDPTKISGRCGRLSAVSATNMRLTSNCSRPPGMRAPVETPAEATEAPPAVPEDNPNSDA